jgi:hypothetical protein
MPHVTRAILSCDISIVLVELQPQERKQSAEQMLPCYHNISYAIQKHTTSATKWGCGDEHDACDLYQEMSQTMHVVSDAAGALHIGHTHTNVLTQLYCDFCV